MTKDCREHETDVIEITILGYVASSVSPCSQPYGVLTLASLPSLCICLTSSTNSLGSSWAG